MWPDVEELPVYDDARGAFVTHPRHTSTRAGNAGETSGELRYRSISPLCGTLGETCGGRQAVFRFATST